MKCSYCNAEFSKLLGLKELFSNQPLVNSEMCSNCLRKFEKITIENRCLRCMKKSASKQCRDCQNWQMKYPNYSFKHEALFDYSEEMQDWFQEYKFSGNRNLCHGFKGEINEYFQKNRESLFVPIPLSPDRLRERGFNQVEELLKAALVPYDKVLKKQNDTTPQSAKNRSERLSSEQPFTLDLGDKNLCKKRNIVIVDDIYTTGRTIFHGAELFIKYGSTNVTSFSLAR